MPPRLPPVRRLSAFDGNSLGATDRYNGDNAPPPLLARSSRPPPLGWRNLRLSSGFRSTLSAPVVAHRSRIPSSTSRKFLEGVRVFSPQTTCPVPTPRPSAFVRPVIKAKALKPALIMLGSVLEGVLLDVL